MGETLVKNGLKYGKVSTNISKKLENNQSNTVHEFQKIRLQLDEINSKLLLF